jgi:hypothetical protein
MNVNRGTFRLVMAAGALGIFGATACTSDANDPGATGSGGAHGGSGGAAGTGAGTGGTIAAGGSGGTGTTGTVCAVPYVIPASSPGVADFDAYDGVSDLGKWSAPLGGDTASGVYAGPFGYGDRSSGFPETFGVVDGQSSKYALRIADTLAANYGGGMGTWLSACLNATHFSGVTFWVKGATPKGTATLTLQMQDTLPATPAKAGDPIGTCAGTSTTCVHPTFIFPVTTTWTKIQAPWTGFTAGNAAGPAVAPDGRNISQLQVGVDLNWVTDATGAYVPVPAPYDVSIDTLAFY